MNKFVLFTCILALGVTLASSSPVDNADGSEEWCRSYEMKCMFVGPHNGTVIHNKGAILDDCRCNFEMGKLRCSNELLTPEAKNCKCKCH